VTPHILSLIVNVENLHPNMLLHFRRLTTDDARLCAMATMGTTTKRSTPPLLPRSNNKMAVAAGPSQGILLTNGMK
jgi:hypothetical protein